MDRFFFSGSTSTKLDSKNRFVLPQAMRYGLVEKGVLEFSISLGLGGCLAIYRRSDMERMIAKFQSKQHVARYQKFFTLFFSTLHHLTCDKLGRTLLPQTLKKAVGIKSGIVIAGVLNKIELWPQEKYDEQLKTLIEGKEGSSELVEMTEEAFALLDEEDEEESTISKE